MGGEGSGPQVRTIENLSSDHPGRIQVEAMVRDCDLTPGIADYMPKPWLRARFEEKLGHVLRPDSDLLLYVEGMGRFSPYYEGAEQTWVGVDTIDDTRDRRATLAAMGVAENAEANSRMVLVPMGLAALILVIVFVIWMAAGP